MPAPTNTNTEIWDLFIASPRASMYEVWVLVGLAISVVLFALAKWYRGNIFALLVNLFFKRGAFSQVARENLKSRHIGDFVLLINFWLLCVLGGVLAQQSTYFNSIFDKIPIWLFYSWPIFLYLWQYVGLIVVAASSGVTQIKKENIENITYFPQLACLIFFPLILVWQLNSGYSNTFAMLFCFLLILLALYIIFKGIVFSIQKSIPYYYIILYICTLEILPSIFIMYELVGKK